MNELTVRPIGTIRSEHRNPETTPIQPVFAPECEGSVEVLEEFSEGLKDIEGFSHIILLYWMHEARPAQMIVRPFLENADRGVFATRAPSRPNPIGLSIVRLAGREGRVLHVRGVDILDGTPLLDIKPYSGRFDCFPGARNGWQEGIDDAMAQKLGRRGYKGSAAEAAAP
jgi:tRNA-Thr(GGU) m(6)t(6)A37 methyltransferase TsaA